MENERGSWLEVNGEEKIAVELLRHLVDRVVMIKICMKMREWMNCFY